MRVVVCGGGLQGIELCVLARAAGWHTTLIDKQPAPPAKHIASVFIQANFLLPADKKRIQKAVEQAQLVLPALENDEALAALTVYCRKAHVPFAFDAHAYAISRSKLRSRELFCTLGIPIPTPGPCFPMVAKPSESSGSKGVAVFTDEQEWLHAFPGGINTPDWIFEEYCPGPSYSIEVCGTPGHYHTFQTTKVWLDAHYDCKCITAPVAVEHTDTVAQPMRCLALQLAGALNLHGIMDVEAVLTPAGLKVLEIDARFPSQTPLAVFAASGVNLAVEWACCFVAPEVVCAQTTIPQTFFPRLTHALPYQPHEPCFCLHYVRLEHFYCTGHTLETRGECGMALHGPLRLLAPFHGADVCLMSEPPAHTAHNLPTWFASTCIFTGTTAAQIVEKRQRFVNHFAMTVGAQ